MTTEPRQEAVRIVRERDQAFVRFQDERTGEQYDVLDGLTRRLLAVLTAAIEHVRANDDVPDRHEVGAWDMDADTFRALRAALSALREDET